MKIVRAMSFFLYRCFSTMILPNKGLFFPLTRSKEIGSHSQYSSSINGPASFYLSVTSLLFITLILIFHGFKTTVLSLTSYLYFKAVQKQGNIQRRAGTYKTDEKLQNHPTDFDYISLARTKSNSHLQLAKEAGKYTFRSQTCYHQKKSGFYLVRKKWQMGIRQKTSSVCHSKVVENGNTHTLLLGV